MKHLKEKYDIGDEYELQYNTAAIIPTKKRVWWWCVICIQTFAISTLSSGKIMAAKNSEIEIK